MLLTFTPESIRKIRRGEKTTTLRRNAERWTRWYLSPARERDGRPLHVWEGNPRSGGRFVAVSRCVNLYATRGEHFCRQEAVDDGFRDVVQMEVALAALHGLTPKEVRRATWAVVAFDPAPIREAP